MTAATSPSTPTPSLSTSDPPTDGIPNEAFEALINLFTSDGIYDVPPTSTAPQARVTVGRALLRDESGRLDFEKICSRGTVTLKENPFTAIIQDSQLDRSGYPDIDSTAHLNDVPLLCNVLTMPFSFGQLNDALGSACDEMHTLHQWYNELQKLVAEKLGKGKECKMTQKVITIAGGSDYGSKQDSDDDITAEVAQLSEEEAKRALMAQVLSLPLQV
ncbi:hypothetical protein F5141DRAFT_1062948 [Pisolithus sp. B1]|nr:hypothetical protein F5141DRAFT_1062948 [Pisolithus sp. B1]